MTVSSACVQPGIKLETSKDFEVTKLNKQKMRDDANHETKNGVV